VVFAGAAVEDAAALEGGDVPGKVGAGPDEVVAAERVGDVVPTDSVPAEEVPTDNVPAGDACPTVSEVAEPDGFDAEAGVGAGG
jgi:hypothetical protein